MRLLPWRKLVIDTVLRPDQVPASLGRVLTRECVRKFAVSGIGFRFAKLDGAGRHDSWTVVRGHIQSRPFGSRVSLTIRASLPEIVVLGLGALFVPSALIGAAVVHGERLASTNGYLVFGILIGPVAWCLLCFLHARRSREVEEWVRSAFPAAPQS